MRINTFLILRIRTVVTVCLLLILLLLAYGLIQYPLYYKESVSYTTTEKKIIALTFDDGPHPRFTPQILNLLNDYNVKATFFVIGKNVKAYPDVLQQIVEEGHEIGNHTFTHIDVNKANYHTIKTEVEETQNIIFSLTGITPKIFRPPYGFTNKNTEKVSLELGCTIVLWTESSSDWYAPGVEAIINKVLKNVKNGDIILMHDYVAEVESQTVEALKTILPELINKGYQFVTVSELLAALNTK